MKKINHKIYPPTFRKYFPQFFTIIEHAHSNNPCTTHAVLQLDSSREYDSLAASLHKY